MFAKLKIQKQQLIDIKVAPALIATASILGSLLFGTAYAADKAEPMPMGSMRSMGSMEMHKSMMGGMKGMQSMKASGDTDYDFAMMMRMHHKNALDMANVELKNGKDAKLRDVADAIIKSQTKEIADFDEWLTGHPKPMASSMMKPK